MCRCVLRDIISCQDHCVTLKWRQQFRLSGGMHVCRNECLYVRIHGMTTFLPAIFPCIGKKIKEGLFMYIFCSGTSRISTVYIVSATLSYPVRLFSKFFPVVPQFIALAHTDQLLQRPALSNTLMYIIFKHHL